MQELTRLSNSRAASSKISVPQVSEPVQGDSGNGIYLGRTSVYKAPFFLDQSSLVNPHVAAIGMTGSGKTYFLKSYIIRSVLFCGAKLFVLDWTGEYGETIALLSGVEHQGVSELDMGRMLDDVCSVNLLHLRGDAERKNAAVAIMKSIIETMHNMPISSKQSRIILLDEAWKMVGDAAGLGQLFREGRKFGFHIVVATQLVKDISNEILSNTASVFVFRLQNGDDCSVLVDSGIIRDEQRSVLPALPVGSCMVRLASKEGRQSCFTVKKIAGIMTSIFNIHGDGMQIRVSSQQFRNAAESAFDRQLSAKIMAFAEANERSIDLNGLIKLLVSNGAKRPDIVVHLRLLGFDDMAIVKAYSSCASEETD